MILSRVIARIGTRVTLRTSTRLLRLLAARGGLLRRLVLWLAGWGVRP
jgi:hypothetical protein